MYRPDWLGLHAAALHIVSLNICQKQMLINELEFISSLENKDASARHSLQYPNRSNDNNNNNNDRSWYSCLFGLQFLSGWYSFWHIGMMLLILGWDFGWKFAWCILHFYWNYVNGIYFRMECNSVKRMLFVMHFIMWFYIQ